MSRPAKHRRGSKPPLESNPFFDGTRLRDWLAVPASLSRYPTVCPNGHRAWLDISTHQMTCPTCGLTETAPSTWVLHKAQGPNTSTGGT